MWSSSKTDGIFSEPFLFKNLGIGSIFLTLPEFIDGEDTLDVNKSFNRRYSLDNMLDTLTSDRLPKKFKRISDGYKWLIGNRTKNIIYTDKKNNSRDAWLILSESIRTASRLARKLKSKLNSEDNNVIKNRILIGFSDNKKGLIYKTPDDPYLSVDIRDPFRSNSDTDCRNI